MEEEKNKECGCCSISSQDAPEDPSCCPVCGIKLGDRKEVLMHVFTFHMG